VTVPAYTGTVNLLYARALPAPTASVGPSPGGSAP
jgi:hypothetical protein